MTGRFPTFSIGSLLCAPVLALVSIPIWRWIIQHQIEHAPGPMNSPDPGQFGAFGIVAGVALTGLFGAGLGLILAVVAHVRREAFVPFRSVSFLANLALVGYGIYLLYPFQPR